MAKGCLCSPRAPGRQRWRRRYNATKLGLGTRVTAVVLLRLSWYLPLHQTRCQRSRFPETVVMDQLYLQHSLQSRRTSQWSCWRKRLEGSYCTGVAGTGVRTGSLLRSSRGIKVSASGRHPAGTPHRYVPLVARATAGARRQHASEVGEAGNPRRTVVSTQLSQPVLLAVTASRHNAIDVGETVRATADAEVVMSLSVSWP